MGLNPAPMPKMGYADRCKNCGKCILGCPHGAKWDCREFVAQALDKGAKLIEGCNVESVAIENGMALGVKCKNGIASNLLTADLIILAAGGFGTPTILEKSDIKCEANLFVDPVLCVATEWMGAFQNKEISMPFVVRQDQFMLSPYFDYLSYFFNRNWKARPENIFSIMIKLADSNSGRVTAKKVMKNLTESDKNTLKRAVESCREILGRMGVDGKKIFLGSLNAGHPGGTLPLTKLSANTIHDDRLPPNLFVADASLFPQPLGNPPIFTIMAMAKRIGKIIARQM